MSLSYKVVPYRSGGINPCLKLPGKNTHLRGLHANLNRSWEKLIGVH